jgi:glycosyltransferase involved in cell wall biosynthesis
VNILWDSGNIGFGRCGINEWDCHVISELRRRGHKVTVIVDELLQKRPKFESWKVPEGGFTLVQEKLTPDNYREVVSRYGPYDVQIGNHFTMFPVCDKVLPVVHDVTIPGRKEYSLSILLSLKGLAAKTNYFACTTPYIRDQVIESLGTEVTTKCLYTGCKFFGFPPASLRDRKPYIAYWGNRYEKAKSFNNLLKTLQFHDLSLKVAGFSGPTKKEIAIIEQLGLKDRVEFHLALEDDELYELIRQASMYVCPSKYEGMGLPAIEAMSLGIPVVTTPCAALPSIVEGAGYIAKSTIPKDLALSIKECYNNEKQTREYVKAGLERTSGWTWSRCAQGIEELAATLGIQ